LNVSEILPQFLRAIGEHRLVYVISQLIFFCGQAKYCQKFRQHFWGKFWEFKISPKPQHYAARPSRTFSEEVLRALADVGHPLGLLRRRGGVDGERLARADDLPAVT